jgi:NADPH:quinone reductase-like Zn-dependent oxidoreductase
VLWSSRNDLKEAVIVRARKFTDVPATMRAAAVNRFGGPAVLTLEVLPVPELDPVEVLIAVHTAGVGSWDADMREGWLPDGKKPRFPLVLGTDGSGTVAAVGSRVRRFDRGDTVYGYSFANPKAGFYAEYVAVAAANVARRPDALTLKEAGAIAATGLTAIQGVDDTLHIKRGDAVVIHGASGGVGCLALQFAKMRGARVLATASGKEGIAFVRRLGADMAADGRRDDLRAAAREFAPDGVDAVLAFAGGKPLTRLLDAVRRGGRLAFPNGVEPRPRKRRGLSVQSYDATPGVRAFERLGRAIEAARITVPIPAAFPLQQAAAAHTRLAEGHVLGRIVLRIKR